jgi:hypothetical protein
MAPHTHAAEASAPDIGHVDKHNFSSPRTRCVRLCCITVARVMLLTSMRSEHRAARAFRYSFKPIQKAVCCSIATTRGSAPSSPYTEHVVQPCSHQVVTVTRTMIVSLIVQSGPQDIVPWHADPLDVDIMYQDARSRKQNQAILSPTLAFQMHTGIQCRIIVLI